jgi:hypothetical protein
MKNLSCYKNSFLFMRGIYPGPYMWLSLDIRREVLYISVIRFLWLLNRFVMVLMLILLKNVKRLFK